MMSKRPKGNGEALNAVLAAAVMASALGNPPPPVNPETGKALTIREQAAEKGKLLQEVYAGFMDAGWRPEQAFTLTASFLARK